MTDVLVEPTTTPPIDERLRARRIEVRRSEGRRRLHRLIGLLVASLVVAAGWALTRSPLLDVDHVEVLGVTRTPVDDVVAAAGVPLGTPLLDVDLDGVAARVEALPWVGRVEVERTWRGTVSLTVVERTPTAVVVAPDGARWLVDADGVVLGPDGGEGGLLLLEGLEPPAPGAVLEPRPDAALGLASTLPARVRDLVAAVVVAPDASVELRLVARPGEVDGEGAPRPDGGRVLLGDGRALADQVRSITTVLDQVDLTDLVVLDVRVPSNPVVTRTGTEVAG